MSSAVKLLEKRCYKEITVLDLVSDSGVNRNTFYYHFKDMPALVEELVRRRIDRVFDSGSLSTGEKMEALVDSLYENRKSVMHVYGSMEREIFDKCLDNICEHLAGRLFECSPAIQPRSDEDNERAFLLCRSCMYGLISGMLLRGLPESEKKALLNLCAKTDAYLT